MAIKTANVATNARVPFSSKSHQHIFRSSVHKLVCLFERSWHLLDSIISALGGYLTLCRIDGWLYSTLESDNRSFNCAPGRTTCTKYGKTTKNDKKKYSRRLLYFFLFSARCPLLGLGNIIWAVEECTVPLISRWTSGTYFDHLAATFFSNSICRKCRIY